MIIYPILKCKCEKSKMVSTNDGNRTQYCQNCNFYWEAPKTQYK